MFATSFPVVFDEDQFRRIVASRLGFAFSLVPLSDRLEWVIASHHNSSYLTGWFGK
jgi:hypothetical protein